MMQFTTRVASSRHLLRPSQLRSFHCSHRLSHLPAVPFKTHVGLSSSTPTTHTFYHVPTSTWTYVVYDPTSLQSVVIDPVLDYDPTTRVISTSTADSIIAFIHSRGYTLTKLMETHAHADHLTAAQYYKTQFGSKIPVCIGSRIKLVQDTFGPRYAVPVEEMEEAFDVLWNDDETFLMGNLEWKVLHLPGHTPDHVGYQCGDAVFVGDSIFLPDVGSARTDFPGGSTSSLFASTQKLLSLPPTTRIFSGHDYPDPSLRSESCSATVEEHKRENKHLHDGVSQDEFERMRKGRDGGMKEPKLLHESIQVNIRAGHLPRGEGNGGKGPVLLKLPLRGVLDF